MKYIVYDDRNMKILFESKYNIMCVAFADKYVEMFKEDFGHIWIKQVKN